MRADESIEQGLAQLEQVGRVRALDRRPVHTEFVFGAIAEQEIDEAAEDSAARGDLSGSLDAAWNRLKRAADPNR